MPAQLPAKNGKVLSPHSSNLQTRNRKFQKNFKLSSKEIEKKINPKIKKDERESTFSTPN